MRRSVDVIAIGAGSSIYDEIVGQCGPRVIQKDSVDEFLGLGFATEYNEIYASLTDDGIPTVFRVDAEKAAWNAGIRYAHTHTAMNMFAVCGPLT